MSSLKDLVKKVAAFLFLILAGIGGILGHNQPILPVQPRFQTAYVQAQRKATPVSETELEMKSTENASSTPVPDEVLEVMKALSSMGAESGSIEVISTRQGPQVTSIDYAKLQQSAPVVLIDQIWELFDLYQTAPEATPTLEVESPATPGEVDATTPAPTVEQTAAASPASSAYQEERERFLWACLKAISYVGDAALTGVIGSLVYDALKDELKKLRDGSKGKSKDSYAKALMDLEALSERLRHAEVKNESVATQEIAKLTRGDAALARAWLKFLGWMHYSNCLWHKPLRKLT